MTTIHDKSRWSRIVQWVYRSALGVASPLAILAGFSLVLVPSWDVLNPEMSLVTAKITSSMGGVAIMVVLGFGLPLVGILLRLKLINLRQRRNDRTAERVMSELRADPGASVAEFYLYLRAFETTGKLRVPLYLRLRKISLGLLQLVTNDLESYVSNAVRGVAPLIALGRPGEAIGAGRIVTEDKNWEADIVTLMKRAKGIFLVPSNRPGTLWEIDTLKREGLLLNGPGPWRPWRFRLTIQPVANRHRRKPRASRQVGERQRMGRSADMKPCRRPPRAREPDRCCAAR